MNDLKSSTKKVIFMNISVTWPIHDSADMAVKLDVPLLPFRIPAKATHTT